MTSIAHSCAIGHQAENCIGFFDEVLSTRWAQSKQLALERNRLKSWVESSRALPVQASCLDQRLSRLPRVKQSILELLKVIEGCLSTADFDTAEAEAERQLYCRQERQKQSRISEAISLLIVFSTTIEQSTSKYHGAGRDLYPVQPTFPENITPGQPQSHRLILQEGSETNGHNTYTSIYLPLDDSSDLGSRLRTHGVRHAHPGVANFWPTTVWKSLLTKRSIMDELQAHGYGPEQAAQMASMILDQGSNCRAVVFTILVLIGLTEEIGHILDCGHGITDNQLPLTRLSDKDGKPLLSDHFGASIHCCFKKWRSVALERFLDFQRCLSVPIFSLDENNEIIHSDFDKDAVLPWCKEVDATLPLPTSDGHGEYVIVRIHPSCHKFHQILRPINTVNNVFALKTIRAAEKYDFRDEIEVLKRFNGIIHGHLVTLLSTFSHHNRFYMMFPLFGIDLHRFFEQRHPTPNIGSISLLRWISKQCLGIMDAVSLIHSKASPAFSHGDIKPENILWYSSQNLYGVEGVLVLSDFGSAGLGSEKSRSMKPNAQTRVVPSYRPPECDMKGGERSSAFDIWTLGCLFLELVCWFMKGYSGIQRFCEDREKHVLHRQAHTFYDIKRLNTSGPCDPIFMVKGVVTQKIQSLLFDPHCAEWAHDLLQIVRQDMLLVLSKSRRRKTSRHLRDVLDRMNSRCEAEEKYCSPPELLRRGKDPLPEKPFAVLAELNETASKSLDDHRLRLDTLENEDVDLDKRV